VSVLGRVGRICVVNLILPSFTVEAGTFGDDALRLIEASARTCYKSESKGDPSGFVRKILHQFHHESVIEHVGMTVRFVVDRGVSHELVRHRLASFSQESTRYVDYGDGGKAGGCTFVIPPWLGVAAGEYDEERAAGSHAWVWQMFLAEHAYKSLRAEGWTPQQARSVLPSATKTEVVMTANVREWRTVFKLRCAKSAHPQMREVMVPLLFEARRRTPVLFDDLEGW
jgi:thymidylate synthase (FAD)